MLDQLKDVMNINATPGTKVIYAFSDNGWDYDMVQARRLLELGGTYTIHHTCIHESSTDVHLTEVPGVRFNSVMFADVEE